MEGRPRLRKRRAPGASPGDCRRCCVTVGGNYLGRQARPRPVAILLATAVAVAGTSGALAFTLSLIPMEWHSVVSWRWSSPGESKLRWQRVGAAYVGTVCHSRGSTSKRVSNRKILLSSAGPTESDSEALQLSVPCSPIPDESEVRREEGDHPRRHGRSTDEPSGGIEQDELGARRDATVTDRTFSVQPWRGEGLKQTGAWERDSGRTEKRGGQGDRGDRDRKRGRKWRANAKSYNSVSERSGAEVKRLSDLMVANFAFERVPCRRDFVSDSR